MAQVKAVVLQPETKEQLEVAWDSRDDLTGSTVWFALPVDGDDPVTWVQGSWETGSTNTALTPFIGLTTSSPDLVVAAGGRYRLFARRSADPSFDVDDCGPILVVVRTGSSPPPDPDALAIERAARIAADDVLQSNIDGEATRAEAAEADLQSQVTTGGSAETAARIAGDAALATSIASETSRAEGAEATNATSIANERTRAQGAETANATSIANETTRAQGAESTLTTTVGGKVSKAGDTMTGALSLSGDPAAAAHAVDRSYLDLETTHRQLGRMQRGNAGIAHRTDTPLDIVVVGDSITEWDAALTSIHNRWLERFARRAAAAYGVGVGVYYPTVQGSAISRQAGDPWVTTGGTAYYNTEGLGLRAWYATSGSAYVTCTFFGDRFTLLYSKSTVSSHNLQVYIDGALATTIDTRTGSGVVYGAQWDSGPLTNGLHVVQCIDLSGGLIIIEGAMIEQGAHPGGVRVWDGAQSGYTAAGFALAAANVWDQPLQNIKPSVVIVGLGVNDLTAGRTAAQIATDVGTIASRAVAATVAGGAPAPTVVILTEWAVRTQQATWPAVQAALRALADSNGYLLVDIGQAVGATELASDAETLSVDGTHPTDAGQYLYSDVIAQALGIPNGEGITAAVSSVNLTRAAVQTSAAVVSEPGKLYPLDISATSMLISLPKTPPDKTRVGFKVIAQSGANSATFLTQAPDVLNSAGGSTSGSLTLLRQGAVLQYDAATAIWTVIHDSLPLSQLDTRYASASGLTTEVSRATAAEALAALKANNLSDLASAAAARTNLGLGSAALQPSSAFDPSGTAAAEQARALLAEAGLMVRVTPVSTKTTNQTVALATLTPFDASAGALTATLPSGSAVGDVAVIEKNDTGANAVTISGNIRGSASTLTLSLAKESAGLVWTGSTWWPMWSHKTLSSLDSRYAPAVVRPETYGAKGDVQTAAATVAVAAGTTLVWPSGIFSAADVGKILVLTEAGAATSTGAVTSIPVATAGTGYTSVPTASVAGSGANATAFPQMSVVAAAVASGGSGYTNGTYNLTLSDGFGVAAVLNVTVSGGAVTAVNSIVTAGLYTAMPTLAAAPHVFLPAAGGSNATFSLTMGVGAIAIGNVGSGYALAGTTASLTGGGAGTPGTLGTPVVTPTTSPLVTTITGYTSPTTVTLNDAIVPSSTKVRKVAWGHDDLAALNAAIAALPAGGKLLLDGSKMYGHTAHLVMPTDGRNTILETTGMGALVALAPMNEQIYQSTLAGRIAIDHIAVDGMTLALHPINLETSHASKIGADVLISNPAPGGSNLIIGKSDFSTTSYENVIGAARFDATVGYSSAFDLPKYNIEVYGSDNHIDKVKCANAYQASIYNGGADNSFSAPHGFGSPAALAPQCVFQDNGNGSWIAPICDTWAPGGAGFFRSASSVQSQSQLFAAKYEFAGQPIAGTNCLRIASGAQIVAKGADVPSGSVAAFGPFQAADVIQQLGSRSPRTVIDGYSGALYETTLGLTTGTIAANATAGSLTANAHDGSTAGGNPIGTGAVDLQLIRSAATQVASGTATVVAGQGSTASAVNAVAIGNQCASTGAGSWTRGAFATDRGTVGKDVFAIARYSATGDMQIGRQIYYASTTSTAAQRLTAGGGAAGATQVGALPINSAWMLRGYLVGRKSDGTTVVFDLTPIIIKIGANVGTTALDGTPAWTVRGSNAATVAAPSLTADTSKGSPNFTITPPDSGTWHWLMELYSTEIA